MIQNKTASVKVLETHDHWFGITYQEDKEAVQKEFARLIEEGVYPEKLWAKQRKKTAREWLFFVVTVFSSGVPPKFQ